VSPDTERNRLRWRCRRGLLELDLLLESFLDREYDGLGDAERQAFAALLEVPDQTLLDWFSGREIPPNDEIGNVVRKVR